MKTPTKTAKALTKTELAHLATLDLDTMSLSTRRRLESRALATVAACNRVIRTARRMATRHAGKAPSRSWVEFEKIRQARSMGETVDVFRGTGAEFVRQALDFRQVGRKADSDLERSDCLSFEAESLRAARKYN